MDKKIVIVLILLFLFCPSVYPQQVDQETILMFWEVWEVAAMEVNGDPPPLVMNSADPGVNFDDVYNSSTTWDITTNMHLKLTARLNSDMPAGTQLVSLISPPSGATATGWKALSGSFARDMVTGIAHVAQSGMIIRHCFKLQQPLAAQTIIRQVTYTLVEVI